MPTTPAWEPARNGASGDLNATNHAAQVDQFLGTHGITPVYTGTRVVTPAGYLSTFLNYTTVTDLSQPFTMSGTSIGRIVIPVVPVGKGADLTVSLYPDSSGNPNLNNLLTSTHIPAAWISQTTRATNFSTSGPLAGPQSNTWYRSTDVVSGPYIPPANSTFGATSFMSVETSGNFFIFVGGITSGNPSAGVSTANWQGLGNVALPVEQPALPVATWLSAVTTTSGAVVVAGGLTGSGAGTVTANVWTASWSSSTGTIGTWSSQTALPTAVRDATMVSNGDTVYIIGGTTDPSLNTNVSTVYSASVSNGQISAWTAQPPIPQALNSCIVGILNGWIVVAGGINGSGSSVATTYYANIRSDGSLSSWFTGPTMSAAGNSIFPGNQVATTDNAFFVVNAASGAGLVQVLGVTSKGIGGHWNSYLYLSSGGSDVEASGMFALGDGTWNLININPDLQIIESSVFTPVTLVSVPMPTTGLTNGNKYHVVLQQGPGQSASDYLLYETLNTIPLGSGNYALKSPRHANTWTLANGVSGLPAPVVPLTVFNNTPTSGRIAHTWEDPSATGSLVTNNTAARATTFFYDSLNFFMYGLMEATLGPNDAQNTNPTFATGVSGWTPHNGTFTQSSAQVHGGFSFSGLLTPTGGNPTASVTTSLITITPTTPLYSNAQWFMVNGWVYSPTGWASVSLSVDWYTAASVFISTSSNAVSVAANTWTNLVNFFQAPSNARFASIDVVEAGTPGATNILYLSDVIFSFAPELTPVFSETTQVTYGTAPYAPTGVVPLS